MAWYDPEDIWDALKESPIGDAFRGVTGAVLPVIRFLPGGRLVEDAINQGADWVKGLVHLPGADIVLKALAMLTYGPLAQALGGIAWFGPQIASAVWALPGVIRGEDFVDAWAFEVKDRFEKLAQYAAPDVLARAKEYLPDTFRYLNRYVYDVFPGVPLEEGLRRLKLTPEQIYENIRVRPDIAALALNYIKGDNRLYPLEAFDVDSGKRPTLGGEYVPRPPPGAPLNILIPLRDKLPRGFSIKDLAGMVEGPKRAPALPIQMGGQQVSFASTTPTGVLKQLGLLVLLTSPVWLPNIVLPKLSRRFR
jgi:hypothetical protein